MSIQRVSLRNHAEFTIAESGCVSYHRTYGFTCPQLLHNRETGKEPTASGSSCEVPEIGTGF